MNEQENPAPGSEAGESSNRSSGVNAREGGAANAVERDAALVDPLNAPLRTETPGASDPPDEPPPARPRDVPFVYKLLVLPLLGVLLYLTPALKDRIQSAMDFPFQIDAEEGFVFLQGLDLYLHHPIYRSIDAEPYRVSNYPPLLPWAIARTMNPGRMDLPSARGIVIASGLLTAQLILMIALWRARRILPALLAPLLFCVSYEFHNWSAFCRVDLPALMFTTMGLFLFVAIRPRWGASAAAIAFVLAAFTKQTAILAPAACCLSIAIFERRRLVWFLAPYLGIGAGVFAYANWRTDGQFYLHLVEYNRNVMNWDQWRALMRNEIWYFYHWWIMAMAFGAICLAWGWFRRNADANSFATADAMDDEPGRARGVTAFYALLTIPALLSFAKVGSAPNYALEPLAAWAIFAADALGRLWDRAGGAPTTRRSWARLGATMMGVALAAHGGNLFLHKRELFSSRNPDERDREVGRFVLSAVQNSDGDVLTEYPIFAILSGREVVLQPFIMKELAEEGRWDQTKFVGDLRRQRFSLIVTTQDLRDVQRGATLMRYTPEMAWAIVENYVTLDSGPLRTGDPRMKFYFWLPKLEEDEERRQQVAAGP